jgi:PEGA domain
VSPNKTSRILVVALFALSTVALWPTVADAQRRRPPVRRPSAGSVIYVGAVAYPRYSFYSPFYDPWFGYGPYWGPYSPYGLGYGFRDELTSSLRLVVTPREAEVYVDGYAAGTVDDYDGIFQRLHLEPGSHEIVLYLEGFRTIRQNLYLNPSTTRKVTYAMERLPAGDVSEPPPAPPPAPLEPPQVETRRPFAPAPRPPAPREPQDTFGALAIRVQPADAEILIDGEPWTAPANQDRIVVQLATGRHHVEIRRAGYSQYAEDVLIRPNSMLTLNVSLLSGESDGR